MCGIVAAVGTDDTVDKLIAALENLEYRGYDSAGIAVQNGTGLAVRKRAGKVSELDDRDFDGVSAGGVGIGHTRWSTHGPPTDENAHPHTSQEGRVAVVHNGIIENYEHLKRDLQSKGYEFTSDTDTEVVPHLIEDHLRDGASPETAFRETVQKIEGSYAIAAVVDGADRVFATRRDSPLVLGIRDDEYYLASDVPAFLEFTGTVVYLEDGDVVTVTPDGATITDTAGDPVTRQQTEVDWEPEETGKGQYDHYMRKEIESQPNTLSNTISGRIRSDRSGVELDDFDPGAFSDVEAVHLVGCGTSHHAARYGERLLNQCGVPARAIRANEYEGAAQIDDGTLFVAVTQSGETADTLDAMREAAAEGARTLAMTNVVGSTAAREADDALFIRSGPEIGVAATKTFSSQTVTMALLADRMADDVAGATQRDDREEFLSELAALPEKIDEILQNSRSKAVSERYLEKDAYFFIGHKLAHPVAIEGALKFKEVTYEHAEGFASGQLKHGPLALVTPDTAVVAVLTGEDDQQTLTNAKEARARGADVVGVASDECEVGGVVDHRLWIPDTHPDLAGLLANIQLQLLSYHTADLVDRPIDKPRNLAKSVTVN